METGIAANGRADRVVGPPAPNRGLLSHRLATDPLGMETALAVRWDHECRGSEYVNGGWGILDVLCSEADDKSSWMGLGYGSRKQIIALDDSHRAVAATVIQWLGTNVGLCFLQDAFRDAGYTLTYDKRPNDGGNARE
jgi:hypothetical protein